MRRRPLLRTLTAFSAASAVFPVAGSASNTILTLEGPVRGSRMDFSPEAPGMDPLATVTPWTREAQPVFRVTLVRLLRTGDPLTHLRAEALNRYGTGLLPEDGGRNGALLATRRDDAPIRDRGPLLPVFPWSRRPGLSMPLVDQWPIWRPRRIGVG
jgi:hypothetical protein